MTAIEFRSGAGWNPAELRRDRDAVRTHAGSAVFEAKVVTHANGQEDFAATLRAIAAIAAAGGVELRGCFNCLRFAFSGASYEMTGGRSGYCRLTRRFRSADGEVAVDFACGEHHAAGEAQDISAAARELDAREPRPSRLAAFEGAMLGLGAGDPAGALRVAEALAGEAPVSGDRLRAAFSSNAADAVPLGLRCWRQPERAAELARSASGVDAAAAALAVALAMRKRDAATISAAIEKECGSPPPALAAALEAFARTPTDFAATIAAVPDAMAGAISGAFNGANALPSGWIAALADRDRLLPLARALESASETPA